jgi:hypothetical protein
MIGVVQKKGVGGGCAVVSAINCLRLLISSTEYPGLKLSGFKPILSDSYTLKLGKCTLYLVDMYCVDD